MQWRQVHFLHSGYHATCLQPRAALEADGVCGLHISRSASDQSVQSVYPVCEWFGLPSTERQSSTSLYWSILRDVGISNSIVLKASLGIYATRIKIRNNHSLPGRNIHYYRAGALYIQWWWCSGTKNSAKTETIKIYQNTLQRQ